MRFSTANFFVRNFCLPPSIHHRRSPSLPSLHFAAETTGDRNKVATSSSSSAKSDCVRLRFQHHDHLIPNARKAIEVRALTSAPKKKNKRPTPGSSALGLPKERSKCRRRREDFFLWPGMTWGFLFGIWMVLGWFGIFRKKLGSITWVVAVLCGSEVGLIRCISVAFCHD